MIRSKTLISLVAVTVMLGFALPASAQMPSYRVVPVSKMAVASNVVIGETLWNCGAAGCTMSKATSRPAIVCEQAAKRFGKLESFTVGAENFDEAALAKCNTKAKA
jgi:hypothetical protein